MRTRLLALIIPAALAIAACASPAASPSVAPSSAAPSVDASVAPSEAPSVAPSVAPSEPPASEDPWTVYTEGTLTPAMDEVTTALTRWGEAATAAAAPDAPDTAGIAVSNAAFRVRTALSSAAALLAEEAPECGAEVQAQATTLVETLTAAAEPLLAEAPTADQLPAVTALIQQAADGIPAVADAAAQACA